VAAVVDVVAGPWPPGGAGPVGPGGAVVTAGREVVVELVSSPRRYLPSSVPPQPAPATVRPAANATIAVAVRRANRRSPDRLVRKRRSIGDRVGATVPLGSVAAVAKHPFLSDAWFDEVRRLHDAVGGAAPEGAEIRMNLMITTTPFDGDLAMHMAAAGGRADWGKGHLDDADVTLTLGYDTARAIFVDGNPQAAIEAFMAGRIIVQGDITKLMAMQAAGPGSAASELTRALQEITE